MIAPTWRCCAEIGVGKKIVTFDVLAVLASLEVDDLVKSAQEKGLSEEECNQALMCPGRKCGCWCCCW